MKPEIEKFIEKLVKKNLAERKEPLHGVEYAVRKEFGQAVGQNAMIEYRNKH